jgi:5S rRNA maturation endonuclease (ribonuclease M5)
LCNNTNLDKLSISRLIHIDTLKRNQVKYNPLNDTYVIPTFNTSGALNQLYRAQHNGTKYVLMNTPGVDGTLFNWIANPHEEIWVCEGIWDKMAAEDIIGPSRQITAVGFPGSNFKQSWCNMLAGHDVTIFTDADKAGGELLNLIRNRIKTAPSKPASVKHISWPKGLDKGYDINDVWKANGQGAYNYLKDHVIEDTFKQGGTVKAEVLADQSCKTFDDLTESCSEVFHYTKDMEYLTHLLITSIYALKIEGEQLWLRIIGPPGSSKTTLATMVGVSEQAIVESTFTGLFSGWKDDDPTDASMISRIEGKALIIKDADALLQQPNKEQIFSELRDYYDKSISVSYRNRVSYSYEDSRSAFIFNGTHALRGMDNSALGERFLDFELTVTEDDRDKMTDKMLERTMLEGQTGSSPVNSLKAKAKNLIDNEVLNFDGVAEVDKDAQGYIKQYSQLISFMRARVERNRIGEISYNPYPEVPTRLTGQFMKLFQCAPIILGKSKTDDNTINLSRRVATDVIDRHSYRYKIASILSVSPKQSAGQLVELTQDDKRIIERELDDMRQLGMLNISSVMTGTTTSVRVVSLKDKLHSQMRLIMEKD